MTNPSLLALAPCPFCGGVAEHISNVVQCTRCGASVFWERWNRRASRPLDESRTASADEVAKDTARKLKELDIRRQQMSRVPFCPDHRDKVHGLSCRQCEIERLQTALSAHDRRGDLELVGYWVVRKNRLSVGPMCRDMAELESMPECVYDPEFDDVIELYANLAAAPTDTPDAKEG